MPARLMCVLLVAGCTSPTQLVVVVDSDLEPGREIVFVDAAVSGRTTHRFEVATTPLPFSFGVTPASREDEEVSVRVVARDARERVLSSFGARTRFVPGRALRLDAPLARACLESTCSDLGLVCVRGECRSELVDPASLEPAPSGEPAPLFDGSRLAPDGGTDDAGACIEGAPCDSGNPCQPGVVRCGVGCEPGSMLPVGASCGNGRTCTPEGLCA
ncbi:MAG: hypothetical protein IT378_19050 [Sandaracinaceae bacterium]|nr:hypothetical protein [Sandaracinaceae bacterium]